MRSSSELARGGLWAMIEGFNELLVQLGPPYDLPGDLVKEHVRGLRRFACVFARLG